MLDLKNQLASRKLEILVLLEIIILCYLKIQRYAYSSDSGNSDLSACNEFIACSDDFNKEIDLLRDLDSQKTILQANFLSCKNKLRCDQSLELVEPIYNDQEYYLVVLVPTVTRTTTSRAAVDLDGKPTGGKKTKTVDYLSRTISVLEQNLRTLPKYFQKKIKFVVFNSVPEAGEHPVYERNKERFTKCLPNSTLSSHSLQRNSFSEFSPNFDFVRNRETIAAKAVKKGFKENDRNPGPKTQKQSRDIADGIAYINAHYNYKHILLMEDDFDLCLYSLNAIDYLINKINNNASRSDDVTGWNGIRISFGLSGVVLQKEDAENLSKHLKEGQKRRPPDHLASEWLSGGTDETRNYKKDKVNVGFKYNLLKHLGVRSSLRRAIHNNKYYPSCYGTLDAGYVFKEEAHDPEQCAHDDFTPCKEVKEQPLLPLDLLKDVDVVVEEEGRFEARKYGDDENGLRSVGGLLHGGEALGVSESGMYTLLFVIIYVAIALFCLNIALGAIEGKTKLGKVA
eukprot:augustus_masked-scaffold_8-processed-gene-1.5-mRNA-1 protein AED:1.00 eAED:1.00 QI:0/-1/0/0/-1/1/1/0/510